MSALDIPDSPNAQAGPSNSALPADTDELAEIQQKMTQSKRTSLRRSSIFSTLNRKTEPARHKVTSVVKRHGDGDEGLYTGLTEEERGEVERKRFEEEDHVAAIRDLESRRSPIVYEEPEEMDERGHEHARERDDRKKQAYVWDGMYFHLYHQYKLTI